MSSTLLEVKEVERLERLIVKDLQNEPASIRDRLFHSHRVRHMIDTITATPEKLVEIYEDKDGARKDEIAALGGQTAAGINVFSVFYDRLKEIREYHRKHQAARVVDADEEFEALLKEEPQIEFSGELIPSTSKPLHCGSSFIRKFRKRWADTLICMNYTISIPTPNLESPLNILLIWIPFLDWRRSQGDWSSQSNIGSTWRSFWSTLYTFSSGQSLYKTWTGYLQRLKVILKSDGAITK